VRAAYGGQAALSNIHTVCMLTFDTDVQGVLMTTKNLETDIDIDAAPEAVWGAVSQLALMPKWSPQCRWMRPLGAVRRGTYTVNMNRQGWKFWPTISKVERYEPYRALAFRTLTNDSTWEFEIAPAGTGSRLTQRRLVPPTGTLWVSYTIVEHVLGGEDEFNDEMLAGMRITLARIKATVESWAGRTSADSGMPISRRSSK
jgi:uncharacterized protein YndB with AHSA1/START domain